MWIKTFFLGKIALKRIEMLLKVVYIATKNIKKYTHISTIFFIDIPRSDFDEFRYLKYYSRVLVTFDVYYYTS